MKVYIYVHFLYGGRCLTRCITEGGACTDEVASTSRKFCENDIRRAEQRLRLAGYDVEWVHDPEKHEGLQKALKLHGAGKET